MIVVQNRIFVSPGREAEFEARFAGRAHLVEAAPGFVRNEVLRPITDGAPYVVMTHWEDRPSFEAWVQSPSFREAHGRMPSSDLFARPSAFEMHEVLGA